MIEGTYRYRCSFCEAVEGVTWGTGLFHEPLRPSVPNGWLLVNWSLACPKHYVVIRTEGTTEEVIVRG